MPWIKKAIASKKQLCAAWFTTIVLRLCFNAESIALAQASLEITAKKTNDGPETGFIAGAWALLFILLGMSVWSLANRSLTHEFLRESRGPTLRNLFLGMTFESVDAAGMAVTGHGFLMTINLRQASFVSMTSFAKGDRLRLDLGSLPNFPDKALPAYAEVTSSRSLDDKPESWLVNVRFVDLNQNTRQPLLRYLESLTNRTGLIHA